MPEAAAADLPRRTSATPRALGILAGGGPLPGQVAAAARAAGRRVFMVGLEGFADPAVLAPWPHEVIRITDPSRILAALRAFGCQDLVLIGPVRRPSLLGHCGRMPRAPASWPASAAPRSPATTDCSAP